MAKMTPEQEAAYALDSGIARNELPPDAQPAYDRLVEQRARTTASAPVTPPDAEATGSPGTMPRWVAAIGTAVFALIAQGAGVVLLPYAFTHWQPGTPTWPVLVRAIGVALIAMGGIVVAWAFARFAAEGVGVPIPGEPNARRLTVGGPYRYVRNPLYVASAVAISGQALALAQRFGQQFEDYRNQVPGWLPRLPRRTP